jgi:hypothetical protein
MAYQRKRRPGGPERGLVRVWSSELLFGGAGKSRSKLMLI